MIRRITKPPGNRRSFANAWGELDYVCKKTHYWLHIRKQKWTAQRYLNRLDRILRDLPDNDLAIVREEGLALLHELKSEFAKSIAHRKREIQLMERLHEEARSSHYSASTREYMLDGRDTMALEERRAILTALQSRADPKLKKNDNIEFRSMGSERRRRRSG